MKFYVGNTDKDWFDYLASKRLDSVNFWKPGTSNFRALDAGEVFLFRLKNPINRIAGGGFFVSFTRLPLSTAWHAFEQENGVETFEDFRSKISIYRQDNERDPIIGCTVLTQPFFLPESMQVPQPENWGKSIVQGKTYDTETDREGALLWETIQARLAFNMGEMVRGIDDIVTLDVNQSQRYAEGIQKYRLGQGAFRTLVIDIYSRRCAMTGEKTLPVLTAAHIKPYAASGPHDVRNGLLLRSDLHTLFDQGYITITRDFHIEVSRKIRQEFQNGKEYYSMHGRKLLLPANERALPATEYIERHNNNVFSS